MAQGSIPHAFVTVSLSLNGCLALSSAQLFSDLSDISSVKNVSDFVENFKNFKINIFHEFYFP